MKRKIIVGVIATVVIIAAAIFVGCIEKKTPITPTETPVLPLTPMPNTNHFTYTNPTDARQVGRFSRIW